MGKPRVAIVVGSLRKASINRQLAHAVEKLAGDSIEFVHADIGALPLYNQDDDADFPAASASFKQVIESADAVLFVTPEYNRSIPGVLKNALDHGSRPYGDSAWAGKPAGIIGASGGAIGTACAQQHLRPILAYLDMPTLNQPEAYVNIKEGFFADDGSIAGGGRKFLQGWLDAFVAWVRKHAG